MPDVASSVMAELKSATRAQHDAAEKDVNFGEAMRDQLSYRKLLEKFYGFYAPLETRLAKVPGLEGVVPELKSRMKAELLAADLRDLGGDPSEIALCETLPPSDNIAEAVGCLYVLEGATLGGQILSRQAKEALYITRQFAGRFFSSYGREVGSMWKRFSQEADSYCEKHPSERSAIVKSATDTFAALSNWMQRAASTPSPVHK